MSCGLAEYISTGTCPTPAIVQEWDRIPDALVQSFTPPGFCNGDCFSAGQGLGDLQMTAPGGFFSSGLDFSQWGIAEWGVIFGGAVLILPKLLAAFIPDKYVKPQYKGVRGRLRR
jgi:hypothetical protein